MCSITAGDNTDVVRVLAEANKTRGTHSYSITYINKPNMCLSFQEKNFGNLDVNRIVIPENHYCIIHQQAPTTTSRESVNIHPSNMFKTHLWHNGIIKPTTMEIMQRRLEIKSQWDTFLLHNQLFYEDNLEDIDGSFACMFYVEGSYIEVFRNEIAPLYTDGNTFSSLPFNGSEELESEVRFELTFDSNLIKWKRGDSFKTVENPYYYG